MAREIWLRTNARALLFGMAPPAAVGLMGLVLLLGIPGRQGPRWLTGVGAVLAAMALATILALAWQMRKPRLAFRDGELLVWLRSGAPIRVPIDVVEGFLLGQAPSLLPLKRHRHAETATLVVRIAEGADEWHRQEVKPQLGKWCEGYITIRGTWCEPLSIGLVNRLNERLAEVTRAASR
ncbi:MAG: hypothetical protein WD063_18630 [Pirellulales bacterium]